MVFNIVVIKCVFQIVYMVQVHTCRLWAEGKARQLSNMWNMDQFFRVTQTDVSWCLEALSKRHVKSINDSIHE